MSQQLFVLMRTRRFETLIKQGINREQDECNEKELEPMVSILAAKVLEKMNPFTLQRCCNVYFSTASSNIICKCESIAYSVFASLASSTRLVIWFQYVTSGLCSGKLMTFISYLFTSGSDVVCRNYRRGKRYLMCISNLCDKCTLINSSVRGLDWMIVRVLSAASLILAFSSFFF